MSWRRQVSGHGVGVARLVSRPARLQFRLLGASLLHPLWARGHLPDLPSCFASCSPSSCLRFDALLLTHGPPHPTPSQLTRPTDTYTHHTPHPSPRGCHAGLVSDGRKRGLLQGMAALVAAPLRPVMWRRKRRAGREPGAAELAASEGAEAGAAAAGAPGAGLALAEGGAEGCEPRKSTALGDGLAPNAPPIGAAAALPEAALQAAAEPAAPGPGDECDECPAAVPLQAPAGTAAAMAAQGAGGPAGSPPPEVPLASQLAGPPAGPSSSLLSLPAQQLRASPFDAVVPVQRSGPSGPAPSDGSGWTLATASVTQPSRSHPGLMPLYRRSMLRPRSGVSELLRDSAAGPPPATAGAALVGLTAEENPQQRQRQQQQRPDQQEQRKEEEAGEPLGVRASYRYAPLVTPVPLPRKLAVRPQDAAAIYTGGRERGWGTGHESCTDASVQQTAAQRALHGSVPA